jgi:hypothetical protein
MVEQKEQKREKQLIIRVTEDELERIDIFRGPMQRATFMRQKSLGQSTSSDVPELNTRAYSELARVGANLNQLMKQLNSSDSADMFHAETIEQAVAEVNALRKALIGAV